MSSFTAAIRAIHALAALRNPDADDERIGVVLQPHSADHQPPAPLGSEVAEWCNWEASIRLGGGKWDGLHGKGDTPDAALDALLANLLAAHDSMDSRRSGLMGRLRASFAGTVNAEPEAPKYMLLDGPEPTPAQRLHLADELLTELMEQAQHHDSGGQTWEMLAAKRAGLGLSAFVLANEKAPTK